METPLKSANLTVDDLTASILPDYEEESEAESHIHMPGPSLWPLLLGVAIFITFIGLLIIDSTPVIAIVGALAVLVGILGFGLENPMAHHEEQAGGYVTQDSPEAQQTLEQAREIVESLVTVGSTAWSAHPVTVEIEGDGVILALYGKVELEAQRDRGCTAAVAACGRREEFHRCRGCDPQRCLCTHRETAGSRQA